MNAPLAILRFEHHTDGHLEAALVGEVDLSNVGQLERQLFDALEHVSSLTLDLTALIYIDSQGARLLLRLADRSTSGLLEVTLIVAAVSSTSDVLDMIRIADLVPVVRRAGAGT